MKKFIPLALFGALVISLGVLPTAAQAVGTGAPVVSAPADGSTVSNGYAGPVSVNFSDAPTGSYAATLNCDNNYSQATTLTYGGNGDDAQTWSIPAITGPTSCSLSVDNGVGNSTTTAFTVAAPAPPPPPRLVADHASVHPAIFYPRVRDGYLDSTTMSYRLNRPANVVAKIRNSAGILLRALPLGHRPAGTNSWSWSGRKADGSYARVGRYKMLITATAERTSSVSAYVTVANVLRSKTVNKYRYGYDTSSSVRTADCYVDYYSFDLTVDLDCWGGAYARASYDFSVPSSAHSFSFAFTGTRGCCSNGTITKAVARLNSRVFRVSMRVTDWADYTIKTLRLTYRYNYWV